MPGYFENLRNRLTGGGNQQPSNSPQKQQFPNSQQQQNNNNGGNNEEPNPNNNQQNNGQNANGANGESGQRSWLDELYTAKNPDPDIAPTYALDDEKLGKLSGSQNFVADITDEDIQKIQSGDWGHLKVLLNKTAQNAHKAALSHSSTLTDKFVGARFEHSDKQFDNRVKKNSVAQQMAGLPNYNNPAVKSHLNDIAERLQRQHPDASPSDIAQEAQRLLMEIANGVNPENTPEAKARKEKAGGTDWEAYLKQDYQNESYN